MTRLTDSEFETILRDNPDLAAQGVITMRREEPARAKAYRTATCVPTEEEEQRAVIAWAAAHEDSHPLWLLYHIPNGGARDKATGAMLKAAGVKAGVPDLHLPFPCGGYAGLWIELKRADHSNNPTDQQKIWIGALRRNGHRVEVCYGASEAIAVLQDYLQGE